MAMQMTLGLAPSACGRINPVIAKKAAIFWILRPDSATHFNASSCLKVGCRVECTLGSATVEEMEDAIIERHNAVVGPEDEVYDLGDFAFRCSAEHAVECLRRLNGRRTVLWGNHDRALRQAFKRGLLDDLLASGKVTFVGDPDPRFQTGLQIAVENQRIILSHYAQRTWQGVFRGVWHLYGHSHGNLPRSGRVWMWG